MFWDTRGCWDFNISFWEVITHPPNNMHGPWTSSMDFTWELLGSTESPFPLKPPESESARDAVYARMQLEKHRSSEDLLVQEVKKGSLKMQWVNLHLEEEEASSQHGERRVQQVEGTDCAQPLWWWKPDACKEPKRPVGLEHRAPGSAPLGGELAERGGAKHRPLLRSFVFMVKATKSHDYVSSMGIT